MSGIRNVILLSCFLMFFLNQDNAVASKLDFVGHVNALDNSFIMYESNKADGGTFVRDKKIKTTSGYGDTLRDVDVELDKDGSVSLIRSSSASVFLTSDSGEHYAMRNIQLNSVVLHINSTGGYWTPKASSGCVVEEAGVGDYKITFSADVCILKYSNFRNGKVNIIYSKALFSLDRDDNVRTLSAGQYLGSTSIEPFVINLAGKELRITPYDMSFRLVKNDKERILRVKFPPGADNVSLIPLGGWSKWINSNVVPSSLYRDIPFNITTTGVFSIRRVCITKDCKFKYGDPGTFTSSNATFKITLPSPYTYRNSRVDRIPLSAAPLIIEGEKTGNVTSGRGMLIVAANNISRLLARPGTTFSAQATIVFDSEITFE